MLGKEKGKQRLMAVRSKEIIFEKHFSPACLYLAWNKNPYWPSGWGFPTPRTWGVSGSGGDPVTLESYLPPPKLHTAFHVLDDLRVIAAGSNHVM